MDEKLLLNEKLILWNIKLAFILILHCLPSLFPSPFTCFVRLVFYCYFIFCFNKTYIITLTGGQMFFFLFRSHSHMEEKKRAKVVCHTMHVFRLYQKQNIHNIVMWRIKLSERLAMNSCIKLVYTFSILYICWYGILIGT